MNEDVIRAELSCGVDYYKGDKPIKGVDYFTQEDIDEIVQQIEEDGINLSDYATKAYVDDEIAGLNIPSTDGLATEDYVDNAIEHLNIPSVPSWAMQTSKPTYTANEVGALPANTHLFSGNYNDLTNKPTIPTVPTKVSAFTNDAGYLTQHQSLTDYATKQYVQDTISSIDVGNLKRTVVNTLPTSNIDENTIYMVPGYSAFDDNVYEEFLYVNNRWEMIGSTQVDLTDYATKDYVDNAIENLEAIIPRSVKLAMDTLFAKAAYADDDAASSYATFHVWATSTTSITAVFSQGSAVIYDTDSLDTLKQYLTVTANYADGTSVTVSNYTLSGTLTAGTSTIIVSYGGKTTTFIVTVTEGVLFDWDYTMGIPEELTVKNPENGTVAMTADGINVKCTSGEGTNIALKFAENIVGGLALFDYIIGIKPVALSKSPWAGFIINLNDGTETTKWLNFRSDGLYINNSKIANFILSINTTHTIKVAYDKLYVDNTLVTTFNIVDSSLAADPDTLLAAAVSSSEVYLRSIKVMRR